MESSNTINWFNQILAVWDINVDDHTLVISVLSASRRLYRLIMKAAGYGDPIVMEMMSDSMEKLKFCKIQQTSFENFAGEMLF